MTESLRWNWLGLSAVALLGLLATAGPVPAHDFWINHSDYKSLTDSTHCCGKNDCFEFKDVRYTTAGWWIEALKELVPFSDTQGSADMKFWRCKRYDGSRRCFFAPQPGS